MFHGTPKLGHSEVRFQWSRFWGQICVVTHLYNGYTLNMSFACLRSQDRLFKLPKTVLVERVIILRDDNWHV